MPKTLLINVITCVHTPKNAEHIRESHTQRVGLWDPLQISHHPWVSLMRRSTLTGLLNYRHQGKGALPRGTICHLAKRALTRSQRNILNQETSMALERKHEAPGLVP